MVLILTVMAIPLFSQHDLSFDFSKYNSEYIGVTVPGIFINKSNIDVHDFELIHTNDTTELDKPIRKGCNHVYINEDVDYSTIGLSCATSHDPCGCPSAWKSYKAICEICLRHIQINEKCEVKYYKKSSKYNKLLKWIENK